MVHHEHLRSRSYGQTGCLMTCKTLFLSLAQNPIRVYPRPQTATTQGQQRWYEIMQIDWLVNIFELHFCNTKEHKSLHKGGRKFAKKEAYKLEGITVRVKQCKWRGDWESRGLVPFSSVFCTGECAFFFCDYHGACDLWWGS